MSAAPTLITRFRPPCTPPRMSCRSRRFHPHGKAGEAERWSISYSSPVQLFGLPLNPRLPHTIPQTPLFSFHGIVCQSQPSRRNVFRCKQDACFRGACGEEEGEGKGY